MAYILIVDDDEDLANAMVMILQNAGYETGIQLDTDKALTSMEERRPDLLVLDVMFPQGNTDGFTLARKMRHHNEKLKGIPIIMLTAVNQEYSGLRFGEQDIDDEWLPVTEFLDKPVDPFVLRDKVSAILKKADPGSDSASKEEAQ